MLDILIRGNDGIMGDYWESTCYGFDSGGYESHRREEAPDDRDRHPVRTRPSVPPLRHIRRRSSPLPPNRQTVKIHTSDNRVDEEPIESSFRLTDHFRSAPDFDTYSNFDNSTEYDTRLDPHQNPIANLNFGESDPCSSRTVSSSYRNDDFEHFDRDSALMTGTPLIESGARSLDDAPYQNCLANYLYHDSRLTPDIADCRSDAGQTPESIYLRNDSRLTPEAMYYRCESGPTPDTAHRPNDPRFTPDSNYRCNDPRMTPEDAFRRREPSLTPDSGYRQVDSCQSQSNLSDDFEEDLLNLDAFNMSLLTDVSKTKKKDEPSTSKEDSEPSDQIMVPSGNIFNIYNN